jgi:hypothetical protein
METQKSKPRSPACLIPAHLTYLDRLQKSGATNMFGARPYLAKKFPSLTNQESGEVLAYWMDSYDERHPEEK